MLHRHKGATCAIASFFETTSPTRGSFSTTTTMRVQNILLVISSVLSLALAAPVAQPDSSVIVARDGEFEARDMLLSREASPEPNPRFRSPAWKREAEPGRWPPSWKREAEAEPEPEPEAWRADWKREAEAAPEAWRADWKREAEAAPEPEAWRADWKRTPRPPAWKRDVASPPDW
ncbi:hypothetical protein BDN71DRAFT_653019 [Pleurotus eryngii]|uniref:Uncharacterized protein n=1 Tax=Pleurotus eryngii TaxID=5323 RepID=A0A9P6DA16_PLEER|nr:hypothetical protein BDN71DRAFT_653019 [Pleurotus eryngii]